MVANTLEDLVRRHATNIDPNLSMFETMLRLARDVAASAHQEAQTRFQQFLANESVNQQLSTLGTSQLVPRALPSAAKSKASCPFPDCKGIPIRPQRNFCAEHAKALDEKEKIRLRAQQKTALKEAARLAR
jgi:hypothetical protein